MRDDGAPIVRLLGVEKSYRGRRALGPIDIELRRGGVYGLVGPNGSGKSTLIRIILGISRPSSGAVELFGERSEAGLRQARCRVGYMPDTASSYPSLSARANIEVRCMEWGLEKPAVGGLLDEVGLAGAGGKRARAFSMGMKRRLDLAVAMLGDPDLLVMDEPVNGLDPTGILEVREFISRLNRERGVTVLVSSHILSELSEVATDYIVLSEGRLVECATASEIEARGGSLERYYASFARRGGGR